MVSALDEAVGNITDALRKRGYMNNALIVFITDVSTQSTGVKRSHTVMNRDEIAVAKTFMPVRPGSSRCCPALCRYSRVSTCLPTANAGSFRFIAVEGYGGITVHPSVTRFFFIVAKSHSTTLRCGP